MRGYFVAGPGDKVVGSTYPWGWEEPEFDDLSWAEAQTDRRWRGAPRDSRDAPNRWLLVPRNIPLMEEKPERLVTVRRLSRGLGKPEILSYGALPPTQEERIKLANTLNKFVKLAFPQYAARHTPAGIVRVPGFWQAGPTNVQLWQPRDFDMPLLVIPYRDDQGLIQACQLRLHRNDISLGQK